MRLSIIKKCRKLAPGTAFFVFAAPLAVFLWEEINYFNVNVLDRFISAALIFVCAQMVGRAFNQLNIHLLRHHQRFWQRILIRVIGRRYLRLKRQHGLLWLTADELTGLGLGFCVLYLALIVTFGTQPLLVGAAVMTGVIAVSTNISIRIRPARSRNKARKPTANVESLSTRHRHS